MIKQSASELNSFKAYKVAITAEVMDCRLFDAKPLLVDGTNPKELLTFLTKFEYKINNSYSIKCKRKLKIWSTKMCWLEDVCVTDDKNIERPMRILYIKPTPFWGADLLQVYNILFANYLNILKRGHSMSE